MGGIWGLASATALENLPVEARGLASGVLQQGYAVGYLIAAVISLYLVPATSWRSLFWTSAGISAFAACVRLLTPESAFFLRAQEAERRRIAEGGAVRVNKTRVFLHETGQMLKSHWKLCIYAVLLMTGFNFLSHGSQDLYPTYLKSTKGFSAHAATVATIIGNCGAIAGGGLAGFISQYLGRRLTIVYVRRPHIY
jgi:SHS family lactate transporter-like MFS transporter